MRLLTLTAALLASAFCTAANAQDFPSHLKKCKKHQSFERVEGEYRTPDLNGGVGIVRVVSQNYDCEHKSKPWTEWPKFLGMKDAAGNLVIPYKYQALMPYSTTGIPSSKTSRSRVIPSFSMIPHEPVFSSSARAMIRW